MSEWTTWETYLQKTGKLSLEQVFILLEPILYELKSLHETGTYYGALTPQNILIQDHFQSCFQISDTDKQKTLQCWQKNLTCLRDISEDEVSNPSATPYLPIEFYFDELSPQSDIYSLCAIIYHAITGITPQTAKQRFSSDHLKAPTALNISLSSQAQYLLMKGLALKSVDRLKTISELFPLIPKSKQKVIAKNTDIFSQAENGSLLICDYNRFFPKSTVFTTSLKRNCIEEITFGDLNDSPEIPDKFWDLSLKQNRSVIAWVLPLSRDKFHLYIFGKGGVKAPVNSYRLFSGYTSLKKFNHIEYFDTSKVLNMGGMFLNCRSLTELNLSYFNTAKVQKMFSMFESCHKLTKLDLSSFRTGKVFDMHWMFHHCKNLTELNLDSFNTYNVTDMYGMFDDCKSLTELDLHKFDTRHVITMDNMFSDCKNLTSLNVSNFNTCKVTDMSHMFFNCKKLKSLDVRHFNMSNVKRKSYMFDGCPAKILHN